MKSVLIGISCSEDKNIDYVFQFLNNDYIEAVIEAGGAPLLLPICDLECIDDQIEHLDGVILSGGIDVNPLFYNDTYHYKIGTSSYKRDEYDIKLVKSCIEKQIPILGICRGMQVINVALGGSLYQDNLEAGNVFLHSQKENKEYPVHSIDIKDNSFLSTILGKSYFVNSFHHQSVKDLGKGLSIIARSSDGIVEAFEHNECLCYGVQFHPEKMYKRDMGMLDIFKFFVNICKEK